jgi:hypothetical protein
VTATDGTNPESVPRIDELHCGGASDVIIRLGPTVSLLTGFGRPSEVVGWLEQSAPMPVEVIGADAYPDRLPTTEARLAIIDSHLDELEARAAALEHSINRLDSDDGSDGPDLAEIIALAGEWDAWSRRAPKAAAPRKGPRFAPRRTRLPADVPRPASTVPTLTPAAIDAVVSAHREVQAARRALEGAKRSERREQAARFDAARNLEARALNAAGASSYSDYLVLASSNADAAALALLAPGTPTANTASPVASVDPGDREEAEIDLRARTARVLGHLPGAEPAAELRALAAADEGVPDRATLIAELEAVDAQGEALTDRRVAIEAGEAGDDLSNFFGTAVDPLLVDGYLFDAVPTATRDALLAELVDVARRRQVVLVSDDRSLEDWALANPRGTIWTIAESHLLTRPLRLAKEPRSWDPDAEARTVAQRLGVAADGRLQICAKHPGVVTRLHCARCGRPCCDVCLMKQKRDATVICVECALDRAGIGRHR